MTKELKIKQMTNKQIASFLKRKAKALLTFDNLLDETRDLIKVISKNNNIEVQANGVSFAMIDPFGDSELSDVISIKDGVITLENGTEANVKDITNVTDLIGLLDVIDA